jgi:restriction system protein
LEAEVTFLEAAWQVLKQAGEPLHYREITSRAMEESLVDTQGKTPARTMNGQLSTDIRGGSSRFVRVGRGMYALARWEQGAELESPPSPVKPEREYLTYKESARQILADSGRPLRYEEITRRAMDRDLINPQGMTPEATMGAQLYQDIKTKGANSAFRKEGKATFGLAVWEKGVSGIVHRAAKQRAAVKRKLLEHLLGMDPRDFEHLVGRLLGAMGYDNITVTRRSADGGIDVVADIEMGILRLRTAVQVKRMKSNVGRPVVSQLRGDMMTLPDVNQGMIITTSGFSQGAADVARVRNAPVIVLIDGDRLGDLLIEHGIGAETEQVEVITFDEERLWAEDQE